MGSVTEAEKSQPMTQAERIRTQMIEAVRVSNPCEQEELFKRVDAAGKNSSEFREALWDLVDDQVFEFTDTYGVKKGSAFPYEDN